MQTYRVWFIGNTHFGHKNILKFSEGDRSFDTIESMTKR